MVMLKKAGLTQAQANELYLKIDQTIKQYVINGVPQFSEGLEIKKDKPFYWDGE